MRRNALRLLTPYEVRLTALFDHPAACAALLRWAGLETDNTVNLGQLREHSLDRIADASAPLLAAILHHAKS
ncbi:MAG: hypothetical protein ACOH2K_04575 [Burkholderiaceae bacterium]